MEPTLVSADFLKACKSKAIRYFGLNYQGDTKKTELIVSIEGEIAGQKMDVRVACETKLRITNYSGYFKSETDKVATERITRIHFGDSTWGELNHYKTFLKDIKKDSDVWFEAAIFNSSENWTRVGFTNHMLFGHIGNKKYLLESYVGPNNFASPVTFI